MIFTPFELQAKCRLSNLNLRAEKHGEENAGAADLSLELTASNDLLAVFDPSLKGWLYVKNLEQPDLLSDADANHLTRLRFPALGTLVWDKEATACDLDIAFGITNDSAIRLEDCTLNKFRITPQEGGSVVVVFRVQAHPRPEDVAKLFGLIQAEIDIDVLQRTPSVNDLGGDEGGGE